MLHNFKYILKTLFRSKVLIFWTYAFPIILGTFFSLAFSNIENSEKLNVIEIGIVEDKNFTEDEVLKNAFEELSKENSENQLFRIKYGDREEVKALLADNKITGYVVVEEENPNVVISSNGTNETVLNYAVEEIIQTKKMVNNIAKIEIEKSIASGNYNIDYEAMYQNILTKMENANINIKDISTNNLSYTMIEFYTLIAMTCLYGATIGTVAINTSLPNMSSRGKRIAVSKTSKSKIIVSSALASFIVQLVGMALLLLFTIFVLKVDFGSNLLLIIILAIAGTFAGLSLGIAVGTLLKTNEVNKIGAIITFTMVGSFLSGMMGITMKYIIDKNIPLLNKINPANMITDGFYSLYYYETLDRYRMNLVSIMIFAFLMLILSSICLRRQKYDNI